MITDPVLTKAVGRLMAMPFFPTDPLVKIAVAEELPQIAASDAQLEWLIGRVTSMYGQWPGLSEIRAMYCSKYKPVDGIEVFSAVYPDGIPSEKESQARNPSPLLATKIAAICAVHTGPDGQYDTDAVKPAIAQAIKRARETESTSADPEWEAAMQRLAAAKDMARFTLPNPAIPEPETEAPRCPRCDGLGVLENGDFCECPMGQDLARVSCRVMR